MRRTVMLPDVMLVLYIIMSRHGRSVPYHAHPCFDAVQIDTRYHF